MYTCTQCHYIQCTMSLYSYMHTVSLYTVYSVTIYITTMSLYIKCTLYSVHSVTVYIMYTVSPAKCTQCHYKVYTCSVCIYMYTVSPLQCTVSLYSYMHTVSQDSVHSVTKHVHSVTMQLVYSVSLYSILSIII